MANKSSPEEREAGAVVVALVEMIAASVMELRALQRLLGMKGLISREELRQAISSVSAETLADVSGKFADQLKARVAELLANPDKTVH